MEHPTNLCPTLQETKSDQPENVGAIGGYQYEKQPYQSQPIDNQQTESRALCSSTIGTHTECALETSRLSTADFVVSSTTFLATTAIENATTNSPSLEDLMKQLATSNLEFQQSLPRPTEADSEPNADLQSRPEKNVPLLFPTRTISTRKPESDEVLLKMFRKVEINIPVLDAIK
ncbi:hypothetical protein CR513_49473, partial [Mucuna pruriens]